MNWKKIIGWTAIAAAILLAAAIVGGYCFLKSDLFQRYALARIEQGAAQSTGAKLHVGALRISLAPLTAKLEDVEMRGRESAGQPPLLHVDEITVGLNLTSLIHRKVTLRELLISHPVGHVEVDSSGASNLPQPPPGKETSNSGIFDLGIGHFAISNGEIYYNDRKTPLEADLHDLNASVTFHSLTSTYAGTLRYSDGRLAYARYAPIPHSAQLRFSATGSHFRLESAVLQAGSSVLSAQGEINDFANPIFAANYEATIHTDDFASLSPSLKPAGDIRLSGTVRSQAAGNRPFIESLIVHGDLQSAALTAASTGKKIELRRIRAHYELDQGNIHATAVEADAFNGRIAGEVSLKNLAAIPSYQARAVLQGISLRALQQSFRGVRLDQVAVAGVVDGTADAAWTGSISDLRGRSDLTIRADARSRNQNSQAIPVNAAIHAVYDGPRDTLTLRRSNLNAPSFTLTADGELSRHSKLQIHAQAGDLNELAKIAASFRPASSALPSVSGSATLNSTIRGSLRRAEASGQLTAENLQVDGSHWKSAAFSFAATPSQFSVSNGSLASAASGRASFDASVDLREWNYSSDNKVRANLSVQHLSVSDLERLANLPYPVSGDFSARISIGGTQNNPSGTGSVNIVNARVYGEPIQTLAINFRAENGSIQSTLNVSAAAGSANSTLNYVPRTKSYQVNLDVPAIALQKLHSLLPEQGLAGTLSLSATGSGTLDDPQLTASLNVPHLEIQHKSIAGLRAGIQVAGHRANLTVDSQVSEASLQARAQVELAGDYETNATIDSTVIPLQNLLATFSSGAPEGFKGEAELHATLKGPLKNKAEVEAHVTIPRFSASYQELQIAAAAPIHADYAHSTLTLQPAEIHGTGTSLKVQGSVPFAGSSEPNLQVQGDIDVRIARIFVPELNSSGVLALNVQAAGSATNPSLRGQLKVQDVNLGTADLPLGVQKLNGTVDIANDRANISSMSGEMGGGKFSLGGSVSYKPNLQFALALEGKQIRLRYPAGLRTLLDGTLALSGNLRASSLTGRVLLDSLSFTPDFDLSTFSDQFSSSVAVPAQPGFADSVKLNVLLQSKDNLSATSSQVSVEGALNLNVGGTAADPIITGRTELTSGEVFYRGNRYQLQRGIITFADPSQTNPNLNLSATTTVEQYNLTINLRGPLDKLTTTYTSDPPLATADVIHLLAFGNTTSEAASSSQSTDAMIASSALGAGLTSGAQKLGGFSSLQIDPLLGGSNQNPSARIALQQRVSKDFLFTFSTDVSQPGQEIVQGDYQISKRWSVNVTRDQLGGVTVAGRLHTKF
ncbi:MAG TPA: translocation/assembly module TamB domain-containing protein [Candidatus Binatia bacterium]|nr:translocation/assembly module TamB domain-containing protein [Candidatus Binatia bacterium]